MFPRFRDEWQRLYWHAAVTCVGIIWNKCKANNSSETQLKDLKRTAAVESARILNIGNSAAFCTAFKTLFV